MRGKVWPLDSKSAIWYINILGLALPPVLLQQAEARGNTSRSKTAGAWKRSPRGFFNPAVPIRSGENLRR